ncbi:MAG: hypothetical protein ACRDK8_15725, partial [Solirubrobacteraceae bacterium]
MGTTRRRARRALLAPLAAVCLTAGLSACGGGSPTGNTTGAPGFTVPTGTVAADSSASGGGGKHTSTTSTTNTSTNASSSGSSGTTTAS